MTLGRRGGFTLVELFAVCVIVAVLATVAFPFFSNATEAAQDAVCRNRLRNLAMYAVGYARREGYYPWGMVNPATHDANYCKRRENIPQLYPREMPRLHGIDSWREYETFCWDFRRLAEEGVWRCGEMFGALGVSDQLGCPKARGAADNWDRNPMTGYNYNVCFIGYVEGDRGSRKYPAAYGSLTHPERVVLFGDGGYAGGCNKFMRAPRADEFHDNSSASLRRAGTQAFRHGRGHKRHCNMSFADCHVESFTRPFKTAGKEGWVDEETHSAFISEGNGIYGPRGWGEYDDDYPHL